jgi:phosphoribosylformylglycinamidine synthase
MKGRWTNRRSVSALPEPDPGEWGELLRGVLGDFAVCSRHPVIREYDHEVQGNTMLKPLAGATGTAPQDGSVIRVDGSARLLAMSLSLLPEWGRIDPWRMGAAVVDECVRQLVICGADPDRLAILDNFCLGNPDNEEELGALVESVKGMAAVAEAYGAPFVSGKDSFYNYFVTDDGPVSIPVTLLVSGFGVVEDESHVTGSSLRHVGSALCLLGSVSSEMGGSVVARRLGGEGGAVPETHPERHMADYRTLHQWIGEGAVLSAHDVSEGGLLTTLCEAAFSLKAGVELDAARITAVEGCGLLAKCFGETPGMIVVEMDPEEARKRNAVVIGRTIVDPVLRVTENGHLLFEENINPLYQTWHQGLTPYY